ncbi:MAG: hypothetical protein P8L85_06115 [Rubripirellula sp.]|nr:hypothetical protein [Rubripirellula sp.]
MTQTEEQQTELHSGHNLEAGLLERVREWTDLFPWWRLIRTLRLAASPTMLAMTAGTLLIWILGLRQAKEFSEAGIEQFPSIFLSETPVHGLLWTLLVWAPPAILLTRQGGLLAAGRNMTGIRLGFTLGLQRSWRGWFAGLMPLVAAFAIAMAMVPLGWLTRLAPDQPLLEIPAGLLSALIAIPSGVIAVGGLVAIPLSWAALGNEQDSDPLNALSRGYESLFRRPLHLAFYSGIAALFASVIFCIAAGIATAATLMSGFFLDLSGCSPNVRAVASNALAMIPIVMVTTLSWGLAGGIYLLLRYNTGGQEVEDLWEQKTAAISPLPELPKH